MKTTALNTPTVKKEKPVVWSIAASDSGGGAGIQADIKTLHGLGVHGCTLITAITAQNTLSLDKVYPLPIEQIESQLNSLNSDLYPEAVKIGVPPAPEALPALLNWLKDFNGFSVWDPVIKASTGGQLSATRHYQSLLQAVSLITPNCMEACILSSMEITCSEDMVAAATRLLEMGANAVLLKGGHGPDNNWCQDLYMDTDSHFWLSSPRKHSVNSHGTGCTLSSAIAAFKAQGQDIKDSLVLAHAFVQQGLRTSTPLGQGEGPVNQGAWPLEFDDFPIASETPTLIPYAFTPSPRLGIYAIVDNLQWMQQLLKAGVKTLQLRIKSNDKDQLKRNIQQAVALGNEYQARIFINDHWELAIEAGAYGIHLGQEDLQDADLQAVQRAGLQLGISTHNLYEICLAHQYSPSYIAIGPIFNTHTKVVESKPVGVQQLGLWSRLLSEHYSLTCIGGITEESSKNIHTTGIPSIALISALASQQAIDFQLPALIRQFPY